MRMRKKKNLEPRMAACSPWLVAQPQALKGQWAGRTGGRPLALEIGCGKGGFITALAQEQPQCFFVAAERVPSVLLLALEKARDMEAQNLLFIQADAAGLTDVFDNAEVSTLYLNFSDPWPRARHHKRRLTHPGLLAVYDSFLQPGGQVILKTDNQSLFEFSLVQLSTFGYRLEAVSLDLHQTDMPNVMTEYEAGFAAQGLPIYRLAAKKPD